MSDVPYNVNVGISKELQPAVPGELHRRDHGHGAGGAGRRRRVCPTPTRPTIAWWRWTPQGKRSGPSDYATRPAADDLQQAGDAGQGRHGVPLPSFGQPLPGRPAAAEVDGKEVANFWDIEKPKFAIERDRAWLKIDPATGVLSGTPDAAGKVDVAVTATIDREVRKLDDGRLGWGNEKVLSTSTERVGSATRRFSIEVGR